MCDPFSITSLALSASASIASYQAQAKNAQAQAKYQNQVALQTGQLAQQNYLQQTGEAGNEISQGGLQVSQELSLNKTRGLQAAASADTAAAEGGVGGNSVDELLQDFRHQEAMAADSIKTNQSFTTDQIINQEKSLQAQAQGRIASSRPGPVNGPSSLALGLGLAGSAFSSYNNSLRINQRGPYDPAGNLQNQGILFRPLPFLGNLLPPAQGTGTFSS
jgi:hypothetical protein